jgi:outer membrane cobalamin receptor
MPRQRWIALAFVVSFPALFACHPQHREPGTSASNNIITQEEIDASEATNVYDVIARLHGNYLSDRGPVSIKSNRHARAIVFLNDQEYGIPETMRNIPPGRIAEIRYFSGTDASARFGSQYGGGVIQLISRNQ